MAAGVFKNVSGTDASCMEEAESDTPRQLYKEGFTPFTQHVPGPHGYGLHAPLTGKVRVRVRPSRDFKTFFMRCFVFAELNAVLDSGACDLILNLTDLVIYVAQMIVYPSPVGSWAIKRCRTSMAS